MNKSTAKRRARKARPGRPPADPTKPKAYVPEKPYKDFPLTPRSAGFWQKKIKGRLHYFGKWGKRVNGKMEKLPGDTWWKDALELYKAQIDDLQAGRTPRVKKVGEGLTLKELCNRFLTAKNRKQKAGRITAPTFEGHRKTTDLLIGQFGSARPVEDLAADDFEALLDTMSQRWGLVRLGNMITAVKSVFKYAYDNGLITHEVRYGSEFKPPERS